MRMNSMSGFKRTSIIECFEEIGISSATFITLSPARNAEIPNSATNAKIFAREGRDKAGPHAVKYMQWISDSWIDWVSLSFSISLTAI